LALHGVLSRQVLPGRLHRDYRRASAAGVIILLGWSRPFLTH
jgi:hypothetical protein